MAEVQSQSEHILALAKELLDDIELSRLGAEALLLKATRLARFTGSKETQSWLYYEMRGYNNTEKLSLTYMGWTGRWIDKSQGKGYWGGLAMQEAGIEARQTRLKNLTTSQGYLESKELTVQLTALKTVRSKVISLLHGFVTNVYYERAFSGIAESIFQKHKTKVDALLSDQAKDVLKKVPAVYDRLAEGDQEAISQALNTCRRIIDAFADAVFPPRDEPLVIDGQPHSLGPGNVQNRINAYIREHTTSDSRRKRLRQTLSNLYDRVNTGVHKDVTPSEARSLFLEMYLLLGEILTLT